ncbi:unnamed protein product [Bursaphelenchus okinawaensis]|uniref:Uncharacterized protein n=1 Tax=Bursaphelenchus okinawaensis TaxID=465554 RepID=A0A811K523_9BILA|nr:unnamed protein product [Bursaphelenchus okinawaensis]CAG9091514.1 unnamed protein product [Bursaphelenchus okinawaensis]
MVLFAVIIKTPVEVRFEKNLFIISATYSLLMNVILFVLQPVYYGKYYGGYSAGLVSGNKPLTKFLSSVFGGLFVYFCISFSIGFSYQSYKLKVYVGDVKKSFFNVLERNNNWLIFTAIVFTTLVFSNFVMTYTLWDLYKVDPSTSETLMSVKEAHPDIVFVDLSTELYPRSIIMSVLGIGFLAILHAFRCNIEILKTIHSTKSIVSMKTFRLQCSFYRHYAVESVLAILLMHIPVVLYALTFLDYIHIECISEVCGIAMALHSNLIMCGSLACVTPYRRWILSMVGVREVSRTEHSRVVSMGAETQKKIAEIKEEMAS